MQAICQYKIPLNNLNKKIGNNLLEAFMVVLKALLGLVIPRVHNIYTKESILLSYTPVEGHIVKLRRSNSEFVRFSLYN